jgi:predicted phage terminase large subunit-like protein
VWIGVEQEAGSGGKDSALMTIQNLAGYRAILDRPTGEKEVRADPFSTQVNAGNVYMVQAPWNRTLLDELGLFPNCTFKDQVDSLSGAFKYLTLPVKNVGGWRKKVKR